MKKILYLSCHEILEFDEVSLFTELGYDVFSMGAYANPEQDGITRPRIAGLKPHPRLRDIYLQCSKENIHPELVEWADVIVMMHNSRVDVVDHPQPWLGSTRINSNGLTGNNWDKLKLKPVVWRSIGQSNEETEEALAPFKGQGLRIVRYSPKEANIPNFCGGNVIIRFYKDPEEFRGWTGEKPLVVTIAQSMPTRGSACNFRAFEEITRPFDRRLFGRDNVGSGLLGGALSFDDLKRELRENRVYFYTGTQPASYTLNFIEAMMTGIPVVALGKTFYKDFPNQDTYEVPQIIRHNRNGYCTDSIGTLRTSIKWLLENHELAQKIGAAGRETAIELFGKEKIKAQWKEFIDSL